MNEPSNNLNDYDAIAEVIQTYLKGANTGRSDDMKPAFHTEATVFGYVGDNMLAGPIQLLFDWHDENGAATELHARIASIDLHATVATVRLELDNWTGHRFTDLFTLLNVDSEWKVMNKVFHLHSSGRTPR